MPVNFRGRPYATVNERLALAHGETICPTGITSITTEMQSLPSGSGPIVFAVARVTFGDGRVFTGISEAQFDATSGADKTNPIEVAETSSVGRALAMAGFFGSEDGIAGAEEMQRAQRRSQAPAPPQSQSQTQSQPAKRRETPAEWYERMRPVAEQHGITAAPLAPDAPPEFARERAEWLLGELRNAKAPIS